MTNNQDKNIENEIIDNIMTEEDKNLPGLLPPQALLSTPPPSLDSEKDSSSLLSPWWSEEPPNEIKEEKNFEYIPTVELKEEEISNIKDTTNENTNSNEVVNISIISFGRSSPKESQIKWKERCYLLATTQKSLNKLSTTDESKDVRKELDSIFDEAKDCSMVCFLKTTQRLVQENEEKRSISSYFNPFYGTWISVAKSPQRCKQHLLSGENLCKKSFPDYYTMELGEELSHSGEYVTKSINKTFSPLQHLTQKYIDSWKDGTQQTFFVKFWNSLQKGDAFYLVRNSTKKLFENALGPDKKPNDKK